VSSFSYLKFILDFNVFLVSMNISLIEGLVRYVVYVNTTAKAIRKLFSFKLKKLIIKNK